MIVNNLHMLMIQIVEAVEQYIRMQKSSIKSLGATLNFIYCWPKQFQHDYQERLIIYHEAIVELFKKYQL